MANNLLSVWGTVGSVVLAILILLVMITIHEFGHYIAGKIFHFKINEFSIGFGPAIFKHTSKKTGELFAVRIIPLGGYCAFAGEDGVEEEEKKDAEQEPFDLSRPPAEGSAPLTVENTGDGSSSASENTTSCPPPATGEVISSCPPPVSGGG